jgi:hypothetical protein
MKTRNARARTFYAAIVAAIAAAKRTAKAKRT